MINELSMDIKLPKCQYEIPSGCVYSNIAIGIYISINMPLSAIPWLSICDHPTINSIIGVLHRCFIYSLPAIYRTKGSNIGTNQVQYSISCPTRGSILTNITNCINESAATRRP